MFTFVGTLESSQNQQMYRVFMVNDGTARIQALRPLGLRSTSLIPQRVFFNIISAIKDVDHDELWLALLREFRQPKTHAPWLQVAAIETAVSETDIFASSTCTTSSL